MQAFWIQEMGRVKCDKVGGRGINDIYRGWSLTKAVTSSLFTQCRRKAIELKGSNHKARIDVSL